MDTEQRETMAVNLQALTKPFPPEQVKQRDGAWGKKLSYIETHSIIERLNEAFVGLWSFTILQHVVDLEQGEITVKGRLEAGGVSKEQFGSQQIKTQKNSDKPLSIGDDLKAAASDALKKCASLFGIGLQLFDEPRGGGNGRPDARRERSERSEKLPTRPATEAGGQPQSSGPFQALGNFLTKGEVASVENALASKFFEDDRDKFLAEAGAVRNEGEAKRFMARVIGVMNAREGQKHR